MREVPRAAACFRDGFGELVFGARCLQDGIVEIGNNPAENLIRANAIGRKYYLFVGSCKGP